MTLNQLLYFQAVAKYEHFRLAAASLNISQPSLSRSIANLEEELGIILFERKGRTVTLTKYGCFFLEHANRILSDVRLAEKQMKLPGGMISIELKADRAAVAAALNKLQLCTIAVSLGDAETLVEHPATMTHSTYTSEELAAAGISEGLVRISVGLEDPEDVIADFKQALDTLL